MELVDDAPTASLDRATLRRLMKRRDAPGLMRFSVQLGLLVVSFVATARFAADGSSAWMATVPLSGVLLATLFPVEHEAGHRSAFRTPLLNEVVLWISAFAMLQAPSFFREFHWQHHRNTQDTELDPEIAGAPDLLAPWPSNPAVYLALVCGQLLMLGKLMFTLTCAILPTQSAWKRLFGFVRPERRRRIAWESRLVLLALSAGIWAGLTFVPGFWAILLAWPIAHVVLGFYLMAEHTGLPHDGSQLHRTRTVVSNGLVRWFMWNMPYHAVHHAHPGIPFHAVPEANRLVEPALEHVSAGYLAFHREALRHAFGRVSRGNM